jgi:hypothetical protein
MQQDKDLKCLDDLIAGLAGSGNAGKQSAGSCELLLEHLRRARSGLLGSMRGEYGMSLQQAKESVACISDKRARTDTKQLLQGLIDSPAV